jgi:hypothetical protein
MATLSLKKKVRPSRDALAVLRDWVVQHAAIPERDLSWSRLDLDDEVAFVELMKRCRSEGGGIRLTRAKDIEAWERLIEKLAGLQPGHFQAEREEAELEARMRELGRRARLAKLPAPTRQGEHNFFAALYEQMAEGFLQAGDVAALMVILTVLHTGRVLGRGQEIGRGEDGQVTLRLDPRRGGLFTNHLVGEHPVGPTRDILEHLAANDWITFKAQGPFQFVKAGTRTSQALAPAGPVTTTPEVKSS